MFKAVIKTREFKNVDLDKNGQKHQCVVLKVYSTQESSIPEYPQSQTGEADSRTILNSLTEN